MQGYCMFPTNKLPFADNPVAIRCVQNVRMQNTVLIKLTTLTTAKNRRRYDIGQRLIMRSAEIALPQKKKRPNAANMILSLNLIE